MQQLKYRERLPHLVLLQMTNEVPACSRGDQRHFDPRLLHAIFPKKNLPGSERLLKGLRPVGLRHGHEFDFPDSLPAPPGRLRHAPLHRRQPLINPGIHNVGTSNQIAFIISCSYQSSL